MNHIRIPFKAIKYGRPQLIQCLLCLLFICLGPDLQAQETIVTYIKKNGGYTAYKDSAAYTSILRIVPNESGLYELSDYYPNENLKRHGWVKTTDPRRLQFEGLVETYYDNGTLEEAARYAHNQRVDTAEKYYRNGVLKEREVYLQRPQDQLSLPRPDSTKLLIYYADSLGNIQVKDGNGKAQIRKNNIDVEQGEYSGGRRTGRWEGSFQKAKYRFEEWYENGQVIKGITTDSLGKEYPYEQREIRPDYPGGLGAFAKFVAQNYRWPPEAVKSKVAGLLRIRFVVDTAGIPTDFIVINDLGYDTTTAGITAIKSAGPWTPGYRRGIPVRVAYTFPINLRRPSPSSQ